MRHPAPDIAPGICYGRLDIGLSEAGRREVSSLVRRLASHVAATVWSSPSLRCRLLAEAIARQGEVRCRADLREMDFGAWEGRPWHEVPRAMLDVWAADPLTFAAPGGETGRELIDRVTGIWREIRGEGLDAIVVTHGGPLRILLAVSRGATPDLLAPAPPIGSVTVVDC